MPKVHPRGVIQHNTKVSSITDSVAQSLLSQALLEALPRLGNAAPPLSRKSRWDYTEGNWAFPGSEALDGGLPRTRRVVLHTISVVKRFSITRQSLTGTGWEKPPRLPQHVGMTSRYRQHCTIEIATIPPSSKRGIKANARKSG